MKTKIYLIILSAAVLFFSAVNQVSAQAPVITPETEPNNTAGTANAFNIAAQNCTIFSGTINPGGDVDFFTFTAPAGSRIWILVDPGGVQNSGATSRDPVIDLLAADGTTVIENDDDDGTGNGGDGTIETGLASSIGGKTLTAGGTYFIRLRAFSATAIIDPYKIFIVVTTTAATPEIEANNTTGGANAIVTAAQTTGLYSGAVNVAADVDYYSVVLLAGQILFVNADGDPARTGAGTDLVVEVRSPVDILLLSFDSGITGSIPNPVSESANYIITTSGTYFIKVRHFSATGTGTYHLMACAATATPAAANGDIVISEFRVRGPNGAKDEFVELYNTTNQPFVISTTDGSTGWALAASDGVARFVIPNGTVIPAYGHYLGVNSVGYSLTAYPSGNGTTAAGNITYTTDIPDNAGIALFTTSLPANFSLTSRMDAVGSTSEANTLYKEGAGYPALTPFSIDYTFYRKTSSGSVLDANDNATDFKFEDTNGTSAGAGQSLGAPGPQNLSSPVSKGNSIIVTLADSSLLENVLPNYIRDYTSDPANNSTFGTMSMRYKIKNVGTSSITRLRFRIDSINTFPSPSGTADLRPRTSAPVTIVLPSGSFTAVATTLEQPPSQPNGGGFNSTLSPGIVTLATPILAGDSIFVNLLFGIQQTGDFTILFTPEALPEAGNDKPFSSRGNTIIGPFSALPCTLTCPANISVSNDPDQCGAVVNYPPPTTSGTCGTVTSSPASGSFFPVGTTTVTATSSAGPTCTFTVTVNDTQAPTIACPADITVSNDPNQCGAVVNYPAPAASDNCSGVTINSSPASGSFFPAGTTTVTSTATDASGNTASCTFTITVNDTQIPVITCPADITVSNDADQCGAVVNYPAPAVSDNCPGVTLVSSPASGSFFPSGTTTVTSTATDASGNSAGCTFTVTVNDIQAPVITCPANITVSNDPDQCGAIVNYPAPTVSDNCPGATMVSSPASGSFFPIGTTTVTSTTTDASGNTATCTFTITVNDTQVPVITCPANITVSNDADQCGAVVAYAPTANDNCPGVTLVTSPASGSFFPLGTTTVTSVATDAAGNTSTCTFTITVNDTQAPVITCPSNITVSNDPNQCGAVVNYPAPISSDNCSGVTVSSIPASGSFFPKGTTTVTATATDASGNNTSCTFTVTVNDAAAPTITCPGNITVNTPTGFCTATVVYAVTAADNCPGVIVTRTAGPASGSVFPLGITTIAHLATDASGNTSACSFTVTVLDGQLPVISAQPVNKTVCATTNTTFSVTASNAVSYQWQQLSETAWNNIAGATSATLTLPAVTSAMNDNSYRAIITGLCTSATSGPATLFVNPLPVVLLTVSASPVLLPVQTTDLIPTVTPAGGTFVWYKNGAIYTGPLTGLGVDNAGTYRFVYTDPNGCVSTSGDVAVTAQVSANFYVYPNPNVGQFSVRFYNQPNETVTVSVYNSIGEKVLSKSAVTTSQTYTRIDIDLGTRNSGGIYLVELHGSDGKLRGARRIIVGHR